MKLEVKESSENLSNKQLLPTPVAAIPRPTQLHMQHRTHVIPNQSAGTILLINGCRLTTVANQQKLDKIVIVLPSSGGPHFKKTHAACGHDNEAVLRVTLSSPKASICEMLPRSDL